MYTMYVCVFVESACECKRHGRSKYNYITHTFAQLHIRLHTHSQTAYAMVFLQECMCMNVRLYVRVFYYNITAAKS